MANGFLQNFQRFEVIAFFSGYSIMFIFFRSILPMLPMKAGTRDRLCSLWPVAYALLGALYLGLQGRNAYLGRSGNPWSLSLLNQFLRIWGSSAIFFGIPALVRRPALSFGHSLVFFSLIAWDIIRQISGYRNEGNQLSNEMELYTVSLVLAAGAFLLVAFCYFGFIRNRRSKKPLKN